MPIAKTPPGAETDMPRRGRGAEADPSRRWRDDARRWRGAGAGDARRWRGALGAGLAGLAALAVGACSPVVSTHGYAPPEERIASITVGADTRGSVRRKIGRPGTSGTFTEDGWYYVSTTIERRAFYAPEVVDRRIIAISFDGSDRVVAVDRFGLEDGRIIDLETRTTPTFGRQLTVLQQILGNIGSLEGFVEEQTSE
ncbi:MAG: outer membrane protein assembly factor BamE [Pseudomonadota bacterium]